jgi:hypothetical protein
MRRLDRTKSVRRHEDGNRFGDSNRSHARTSLEHSRDRMLMRLRDELSSRAR